MKWFGGKTELRKENEELRSRINDLVRALRKVDDGIFAMSQCSSWEQMRPIFANLQDIMIARKVAESDRVSNIVQTELERTYGNG